MSKQVEIEHLEVRDQSGAVIEEHSSKKGTQMAGWVRVHHMGYNYRMEQDKNARYIQIGREIKRRK